MQFPSVCANYPKAGFELDFPSECRSFKYSYCFTGGCGVKGEDHSNQRNWNCVGYYRNSPYEFEKVIKMEISYILAGYNEAPSIEESIRRIVKGLENDFDDYELILVDDASTDGTREIMECMAQDNPRIKVLHNFVNLNFGTSVLRGMQAAQKEWIIYNAVDLPLYPEETKDVINAAQEYDVLVLERTSYCATLWRRITSKCNSLLLHILYPKLIRGTPVLNYLQAFRRDCINQYIPLARSPIFVWPEMVFRAKLAGLRVGNLQHDPHEDKPVRGSFGKPHDIMWGIYDMLRFRVRLWCNNY